jgi:protein-L-isoaspartate(D-aspartate) O-methyltransferase
MSWAGDGYVRTPDDDPAFIYQNALVALESQRGISIGQPGAHALWLDALALKEGETVLQVGTGTGYYTAIIAHLVGIDGLVHAYEIDAGLAARASENLKACHKSMCSRDQAW